MKKQIRKNIFETNSSSTHSIVIGNNGEDIYANLPEKVRFTGGAFGWEHEVYTDIEDKASYLFTSLLYTDTPFEYVDSIKETLSKWGVEAEFDEIIEKHWSDGSAYYKTKDGYNDYVDHGNENKDLVKALCSDDTLLMNYLFSNGTFIETSNDNDTYTYLGDYPANTLLDYYKGN